MRNFDEIFRKDVPYDNIKSHKKSGLHTLSRTYIFGEIPECGVKLSSPAFLGLKSSPINNKSASYLTQRFDIFFFINKNANANKILFFKFVNNSGFDWKFCLLNFDFYKIFLSFCNSSSFLVCRI